MGNIVNFNSFLKAFYIGLIDLYISTKINLELSTTLTFYGLNILLYYSHSDMTTADSQNIY